MISIGNNQFFLRYSINWYHWQWAYIHLTHGLQEKCQWINLGDIWGKNKKMSLQSVTTFLLPLVDTVFNHCKKLSFLQYDCIFYKLIICLLLVWVKKERERFNLKKYPLISNLVKNYHDDNLFAKMRVWKLRQSFQHDSIFYRK